MTKDLWLVTSGILNDYGIYSQQQRFDQLLASIDSINTVMPGSDIVVIESANRSWPDAFKDTLESRNVEFAEVVTDTQFNKSDSNQFGAKIIGEIMIWQRFLSMYEAKITQCRRIHKLSGRYRVLPRYSEHEHDQKNVLIRKPQSWPYSPEKPDVFNHIYPTRLWSFHSALYWPIRLVWEHVRDNSITTTEQNRIMVLEHTLYDALHLFMLPCKEVDVIGVEGHYAQDGNFVSE